MGTFSENFEHMLNENRRSYEWTLLGAAGVGLLMSIVGHIIVISRPDTAYTNGIIVATIGLVLLTISLALSYPIQTIRTVGETGGTQYDRVKHWTQLKVSSILLNLIGFVAGLTLIIALLSRINVIDVGTEFSLSSVNRVISVIALVVTVAMGLSYYLSLRTPIERTLNRWTSTFFAATMLITTLLALSAGYLAFLDLGQVQAEATLRESDVPFLLLGAYVAITFGLFLVRSLPTVYALFSDESEYYKGLNYLSKEKSVIMPTMMAFALLFLIVFLLIVFQVGIGDLAREIPNNAVLLVVMLLIFLALLGSIGFSIFLSRSEDKIALYQEKRTLESTTEIAIVSISLVVAGALFIISALVYFQVDTMGLGAFSKARWLDFLSFGLLAAMAPYGFYKGSQARRIKHLEERFPDFLRDLAASRKAGLTLEASVRIAARGEYGALSPEIEKMADQLSWNVPFNEALEQFGERVSTPLIMRATSLINEAGRSGGHVTDVLHAAATDAREIKNLENERRTTMGLYTAIIYIAFLVFLSVVAILYGTLVPEILRASEAATSAGGAGRVAGFNFAALTLDDYRQFYFLAAIVQGVGNGLIAGLMESGRAILGLRHATIMVIISYVIFTFVVS